MANKVSKNMPKYHFFMCLKAKSYLFRENKNQKSILEWGFGASIPLYRNRSLRYPYKTMCGYQGFQNRFPYGDMG